MKFNTIDRINFEVKQYFSLKGQLLLPYVF